ncbi:hypothetical protein AB0M72_08925 [Nocardiopsis dassonvillei]
MQGDTADAHLVRELRIERERIDRMIADLRRSRELLDDVIASAEGVGAEEGSLTSRH